MDALSDVLGAVRLTSNAFLDARFTAPWCVASQVGPEDFAPLGSVPTTIIAYHCIFSGEVLLSIADNTSVLARAGDIVLLPRNSWHALASEPGLRPSVITQQIQPPDGARPAALRFGGGGRETHIVCGYLGCDVPDNPLIAALPTIMKLDVRQELGGSWISASFQRAAEEFATGGVGSTTVLSKLAELLFVEAVRCYLATLPEDQTGWLAGLRDRIVGRALALLHGHPGQAWTTEELARQVGLSRSAFAERFTAMIGVPPMRYLAHWRLQLAAARLRESPRSIAQIAYEVGYESEAAFCRAFKKMRGISPGAWRHGNDKSDLSA